MPVRIRLQRHGKKGKPFYHIVAADARAKRDGRFIEKLGTYNPNTNPATIDLSVDKAVDWLAKGAEPTDTARAILSYKGVLYKHHLNRGVLKGALTQEQADARFDAWAKEKESKIEAKKDNVSKARQEVINKQLEAEKEKLAAELKAREEAEAAAAAEVAAEEAAAEEIEGGEEAPAAEASADEAPVAEIPSEEDNKEESEG